jgi:hypothetical protein
VYGKFPDGELDHRDGNPANNRLLNLRPATRPQNTANVRRSSRNTSGYKGVSYAKDKRKWSAHIYARSRRYFLGYFATPEQAHEAYAVAAKQLHGEFANDGRDAR